MQGNEVAEARKDVMHKAREWRRCEGGLIEAERELARLRTQRDNVEKEFAEKERRVQDELFRLDTKVSNSREQLHGWQRVNEKCARAWGKANTRLHELEQEEEGK